VSGTSSALCGHGEGPQLPPDAQCENGLSPRRRKLRRGDTPPSRDRVVQASLSWAGPIFERFPPVSYGVPPKPSRSYAVAEVTLPWRGPPASYEWSVEGASRPCFDEIASLPHKAGAGSRRGQTRPWPWVRRSSGGRPRPGRLPSPGEPRLNPNRVHLVSPAAEHVARSVPGRACRTRVPGGPRPERRNGPHAAAAVVVGPTTGSCYGRRLVLV